MPQFLAIWLVSTIALGSAYWLGLRNGRGGRP